MVRMVFIGWCIEMVLALRGPHHPRGGVSHHHYAPQKNLKLTQDAELLHDTTHLKEDMGSLADQLDLSAMTEQELEFHYFKLHDVDNNTKLDGLEILHAIQHSLHENDLKSNIQQEHLKDKMESENEDELSWIVEWIDHVLEEDDLDNDGYLGYMEYVMGRQRDQDEKAIKTSKVLVGT